MYVHAIAAALTVVTGYQTVLGGMHVLVAQVTKKAVGKSVDHL